MDLPIDRQVAIVDLNFREPFQLKTNPFLQKIKEIEWKSYRPLMSTFTKSFAFTEVDNVETFKNMINELKKAQYWAIDVEHSDKSYSGIVCLIQISTTDMNFLIDPFPLHRQIKTLLKPLLESKDYVKVMHGCFNDLKWFQRDFNIFMWPVIDTQIIYRELKKCQDCQNVDGVPNISNISLNNLIKQYLPVYVLKDDYALDNFRQRPLPVHLKVYAMSDTIYILPILMKMNYEFENYTKCAFQEIYYKVAVYLAEKALYQGKSYPSLNDIKCTWSTYKTENTDVLLKELYRWRDNLARALDKPPETILPSPNLIVLSKMTFDCRFEKLANICLYKESILRPVDLRTIHDIIMTRRYNEFKKCKQCNFFEYDLSAEDRVVRTSHLEKYFPESRDKPEVLDMTKYLWFMNKYPYTILSEIECFAFSSKDLAKFIDTAINQLDSILSDVICAICSETPLNAKVYSCDHCSSVSIGCTLCWNGFKSVCPQCEIIVGYLPVKFEPVNKIMRESSLFRDSIERLHCGERLPAIIRLFEILEIEIMCDFCFHHLTETMLVEKGNGRESVRCCRGCHIAYMDCYGRHGIAHWKSIELQFFDEIVTDITELLKFILRILQDNTSPFRDNEYKDMAKQKSFLREKGLSKLPVAEEKSWSYCTII